jgi:integrase
MSVQLARVLERLQTERKAETLRRRWPDMPPWLFCTENATPLDESRVRKALPTHFSPHSLRHSYASLLLQQGESPAYVQRRWATRRSSLRSTPTESGCPWGTKPPSIGLTISVVAKW